VVFLWLIVYLQTDVLLVDGVCQFLPAQFRITAVASAQCTTGGLFGTLCLQIDVLLVDGVYYGFSGCHR
jgi:uncharacterized ParB-like nuclease family protein